MLKIALVLVKNVFFGFKKGISGLLHWVAQKHTATSPLLNVSEYWKSSNTKACAKKLSQILANNIDNGERKICHRIGEVLS